MTDTRTKAELDLTRAAILAGMWGGGEAQLDPNTYDTEYTWEGRPDGLCEGLYNEACVTLFWWGEYKPALHAPPGYAVAGKFSVGEADCPECGAGTDAECQAMRPQCRLCEGDGTIYMGDGWQIVILTINPIRAIEVDPEYGDNVLRAIACAVASVDDPADDEELITTVTASLRAMARYCGQDASLAIDAFGKHALDPGSECWLLGLLTTTDLIDQAVAWLAEHEDEGPASLTIKVYE